MTNSVVLFADVLSDPNLCPGHVVKEQGRAQDSVQEEQKHMQICHGIIDGISHGAGPSQHRRIWRFYGQAQKIRFTQAEAFYV